MIKEIIKDEELLSKKCERVRRGDPEINNIIQDLLDTANEYPDFCIGLAANQIGYNKRIIIMKDKLNKWLVMINPEVVFPIGKRFLSKESCMSFEGEREVERYFAVQVMYQDRKMKTIKVRLSDTPAIIVQHEIDHTYGRLV